MAEDWIKMRLNLHEDAAVISMAIELDKDEFSIVGRLHRLWAWADQQTEDGTIQNLSAAFVDRFLTCPGFFAAMSRVGWIEEAENGFRFPNFETHNGESAKRRAKDNRRKSAERKGKQASTTCPKDIRDASVNVPEKSGQKPDQRRGEKRREEKNTTPTPPTPSSRPSEPPAATAVKSEKAGEGKEPEEFARFREWGAIQAELRNLGMVATEEPIDNLQIQGLTPEHAREIIAYWRSKPKDYWPDPIRALRSKMVRTVEGEEVDAAWLQPSDRYTSLEKANRGEEERQRRIREAERAELDREKVSPSPSKPQPTPEPGESAKDLEPVYGPVLDAMSVEERDALAIPIYGQPEGFHFQLYRRSWKKEGNRIRRQLMQEIAKRNPVMSHSN